MNAGIHIKKALFFYSQNWEVWKVLSTAVAIVLSLCLKVLVPIIGLLILILIDMRFGVKKYVKTEQENGTELKSEQIIKNLQSGGIRRTFSRIGDYLIVIITFLIFEAVLEFMGINIKYANFSLSNLVVLLLCITELKSIDENIREIEGIGMLSSVLDFVFRRKSVNEIITNNEKTTKNDTTI